MPEEDSIDFFAKYKGWVSASSITCTASTTPIDVSAYLVNVRSEAADKAFAALGIDAARLDSYSQKLTAQMPNGEYSSIPAIYKSLGSAQSEQEIDAASAGREELKPFAKTYILRASMARLGLQWCLSPKDKIFNASKQVVRKNSTVPSAPDGISFMAKYRDWISIKKLSITANTKPEEISAHLSSIRMAADRKAPQILGVDTEVLDEYAMAISGNMRRSAANLEKIVASICSDQAKNAIDLSCKSDPSIRSASIAYLLGKMLQNIKMEPEVSIDTLMDMFPDLKIPKPKGRMPGQKKKKQKSSL